MPQLRILLACPRMSQVNSWRSILSQDPDVELVGEVNDPINALVEAGETHATVVVIDLPPTGRDPGLFSHLLEEYPTVKVVAVSEDGNEIVKYERGILRSQVKDASPQGLRDFLRSLHLEQEVIPSDIGSQLLT
jgi:DNA-binding NarL/FixJ family response regulator